MSDLQKKSIIIAIIGRPNAGKSLLLNKLVKQKISAVTYKAQTTRNVIRGIVCEDNIQMVYIDSPGIFAPKRTMEKSMVKAAWSSLSGSDLVIILIDSTKIIDESIIQIIKRIKNQNLDFLLVQNKIDKTTSKEDTVLSNLRAFSDNIFQISAKRGDNLDVLVDYIKSKAKTPMWLYGEDEVTNVPIKFLAEEITREQLYLNLDQELPYRLTVNTEVWDASRRDGSVKICQVIVVSSASYKKIILGDKGHLIKKIGTKARMCIEKELGIKAHLFLFIKVRKNWEENPLYFQP